MPKPLTATPWGRAMESLRVQSGLSKAEMSRRTGILKDQYYRVVRGVYGPSVMVLDRWLHSLGFSWSDWAEEFEGQVERDSKLATPIRKPPKRQRSVRGK